MPHILTGLRLGLGHALIGIVVGEMYGASAGIGYMMQTAGATFQTDKVMVGILIIAGAGMALTQVLKMIEKRFDAWRPDHQCRKQKRRRRFAGNNLTMPCRLLDFLLAVKRLLTDARSFFLTRGRFRGRRCCVASYRDEMSIYARVTIAARPRPELRGTRG